MAVAACSEAIETRFAERSAPSLRVSTSPTARVAPEPSVTTRFASFAHVQRACAVCMLPLSFWNVSSSSKSTLHCVS